MAVEPLYNEKSVLLQKLRMSETVDTDTLTMIDQAISDVRLEFYRRLTLARATELAALPSVDNPTTSDEVLRGVAEVTEIYWVMYKLVCILPVMYIETQFAIRDNFDDVPIVRDADSISAFRQCLRNSVEQNLGQLEVPIDNNTGSGASVSIGRPTPLLMHEVFPGRPVGI